MFAPWGNVDNIVHVVSLNIDLKILNFLKYLTNVISGNPIRLMNYWNQTYFQVSSPNAELNHDAYDSYEVIPKYGTVRVSGKASKNKVNARTTKLRAYFQRMFGFLRCRKICLSVCCRKTQRLKKNAEIKTKTQRLKQNLSTCSFIWIWSLASYRNSR